MKLLIKLGGTLLDCEESRNRLAHEITAVAGAHHVTVVHGGGKQMTRFLAERGIESRFVAGLRVTTPEVLDAVLKVFAGTVNHELVAAFVAAGTRAVGLSGIDAGLAACEPLDPALGSVGRQVGADTDLLDLLTGHGYLPVVACVGGDRTGRIYNVNADQMAVACATAWRADCIVFLTDVEGVRGRDGGIVSRLTAAAARELISEGIATGGMQAKLSAAEKALEGGAGTVIIAPGSTPGVMERLLAGEALGTRMLVSAGQEVPAGD